MQLPNVSSNKRSTPRNITEEDDKSASKNTPQTEYKIPVIKVNPSKTSSDESKNDHKKKQPLESLEFTKFENLPDGCTCTTVCSCPVEGSSNKNRKESFDSTQGQPPTPNNISDVEGYESDLDTGKPQSKSNEDKEQQSNYEQQSLTSDSNKEFVEKQKKYKISSPKNIIVDKTNNDTNSKKANEPNCSWQYCCDDVCIRKDPYTENVSQLSENRNKMEQLSNKDEEMLRDKTSKSDDNNIENTDPETRQDVTENKTLQNSLNQNESDVIIEETQDGEDTLTEDDKSLTSSPDPIFESTRIEGLGKR